MKDRREVYLDYSASTPVDARVLAAMMPYFDAVYGNASSAHSFGRKAERAVEEARAAVAAVLNCKPAEIVFTSGGSESDNLAIRGAGWAARQAGRAARLITSPIEHEAVSATVAQMGAVMGFETAVVAVDRQGCVDGDAFRDACAAGGALASVIYASNELGTIQDLARLSAIARQHGLLFHTDAVQAGGQLDLDVQRLGVDLLSLSAHKFYGPKGVGVLYVREGLDLLTAQTGGTHERGRRAGTHNTASIVGLAKALELAQAESAARRRHYRRLRDGLIEAVLARVPGAALSGHPTQRLPAHASFVLDGVDANALLMHLDMHGIAASSGSACKTGNPAPAASLLACGYSPAQAQCGLRLSVGSQTREDDIDYAVEVLADVTAKLRRLKRELQP